MNKSAGKVSVKSPRLRSKELSISDYFIYYFYLLSNLYYPMFIHATLTKVTKNTRAEIERDGS